MQCTGDWCLRFGSCSHHLLAVWPLENIQPLRASLFSFMKWRDLNHVLSMSPSSFNVMHIYPLCTNPGQSQRATLNPFPHQCGGDDKIRGTHYISSPPLTSSPLLGRPFSLGPVSSLVSITVTAVTTITKSFVKHFLSGWHIKLLSQHSEVGNSDLIIWVKPLSQREVKWLTQDRSFKLFTGEISSPWGICLFK